MTIYRRGDIYWIDVMVRGKRHRESAGTIHRHEAEVYEDGRRKELTSGHGRKATNGITLHEAIEKALSLHWRRRRGSRTTLANARSIEANLGGETKLEDIEESTIAHMIERLVAEGNRPATINRKLSLLRKLFKMAAHEWRVIERMPRFETFTERRGEARVLSDREEKTLLSTLRSAGRDDAADLYAFLLDAGCRLGEALSLEWRDVDLDNRSVGLRSAKAEDGPSRSVPLSPETAAILSTRRERGDAVPFALTANEAQYHWRWARKEMKLEEDRGFVIQALRHTCASRMVSAGVDLEAVKNRLGHSTLKLTERYGSFMSDLSNPENVPEDANRDR